MFASNKVEEKSRANVQVFGTNFTRAPEASSGVFSELKVALSEIIKDFEESREKFGIKETLDHARNVDLDDRINLEPTVLYEDGTTTIGLNFNGGEGIVVAVDHAMTSPGELPENVLKINSHLLVAFSGGNIDSRYYLRYQLQEECSKSELDKGRKLSAAELMEHLAARFSSCPDSDKGWSLGILIAGWDSTWGKPFLYRVNGKGEGFSDWMVGTGSASKLALWKASSRPVHLYHRGNLTEAIELAKRALCYGVYRSPERLGYVTVYHVGESGVTTTGVRNEDIQEFMKMELGTKWVDPNTRTWFQNGFY